MKLTAAISASYFGAEVRTPDGDGVMTGIRKDVIGVARSNEFYGTWYDYDQCQLILTPLSKISDEDAVEVAKIMGVIDTDCGVEDYEYWGNYVKKSYIHEGKSHRAFIVSVEVIDYLRSKGYDCGHGSIPSLIAAGVAVEKKEI